MKLQTNQNDKFSIKKSAREYKSHDTLRSSTVAAIQ